MSPILLYFLLVSTVSVTTGRMWIASYIDKKMTPDTWIILGLGVMGEVLICQMLFN